MSQFKSIESFAEMLPNGASTIITGIRTDNNKTVLFVVCKKDSKSYIKEVASKEEGRAYMDELFGGKSICYGAIKR